MIDIGNTFGKGRKCECGERETAEHLLKCLEGTENLETEWIRETDDIEK